MRGEFESNLGHILAEQSDPSRAIGLLQMTASWQGRAAVEDSDIVEAEKPAFEEASAEAVLAVYPPTEIRRQPAEHPLEEIEIGLTVQCLLHSVEEDRPPGLYWWIYIAEIPLVGWDLSSRMQVHLAEQQVELLFGEIDVDGRQGDRVKSQIPSGKPGILPFVRHRDDMVPDHVEPLAVADLMRRRPHRIVAVFLEPSIGVVKEILFAPQHPGQCLPHHIGGIRTSACRRDRLVERVGVGPPICDDLIELAAERIPGGGVAQP